MTTDTSSISANQALEGIVDEHAFLLEIKLMTKEVQTENIKIRSLTFKIYIVTFCFPFSFLISSLFQFYIYPLSNDFVLLF